MKKCIILLGLLLTLSGIATARTFFQNTFIGVEGRLLKNVEARVQTQQASLVAGKLNANKIKLLYSQAPKQIKQALQPFGYFRSKVTTFLRKKGNVWQANYNIQLGQALKVTSIKVTILGAASNDPMFIKLRNKLLQTKGKTFTTRLYNRAKEKLFDLATERGYLTAEMRKSIAKINLEHYTCNLEFVFASGKRYRYGDILFSKTPFSTHFLWRFLEFKPGDYYSSAAIHKTRTNFDDSGLFRSALIEPWAHKAKNNRVPILMHLQPRKSQQYTFGTGYGTDTGIRGLIGVGFYNLTSTGQHFYATYKMSQRLLSDNSRNTPKRQGSFEAHYIIPGEHPSTDRFDINAATEYEDNDQGLKGGVAFITQIPGDWQQIIQLNLQRDWFTPEDKNKTATSTLLIPGIAWIKSRGNDPIRPTRGYRLELSIQGSLPIKPVSDTPFLQTEIQAKAIQPLTKNRKTLLVVRALLGYTAVKSISQLPESLLFYAGGSQSVRGYAYEEIGPGTQVATGSIELRRKIHGHFYGAAFYDAGNASKYSYKLHDFKQGTGAGLVWLSPIGAIELTFAVPIGESNSHARIQFTMGPEL